MLIMKFIRLTTKSSTLALERFFVLHQTIYFWQDATTDQFSLGTFLTIRQPLTRAAHQKLIA